MDEQQALLVILDALQHAKNLYEMTLMDKMSCNKNDYLDDCGFRSLINTIGKVSERISEIEDELELDEGDE